MTSEELRTERLLLRPVDRDDVDGPLDLFSRPEVARWSGDGTALATREQGAARAERYLVRGGGREGLGVLGVRPVGQADAPLVGVVLLVPLPSSAGVERDDTEIGWHLHPGVWGRGYATEAGTALVARAHDLGLAEVHAVTHPDNVASQAVCGRLGMTDLGLRDDWYDRRLRAYRLPLAPDPA